MPDTNEAPNDPYRQPCAATTTRCPPPAGCGSSQATEPAGRGQRLQHFEYVANPSIVCRNHPASTNFGIGSINAQTIAGLRQSAGSNRRYLLRTNLGEHDPAELWTFYTQLTEVEQAFKELKHDLAVRPIFHRTEERIEAHIFVAFLAYCLQVTLKAKLKRLAHGITPAEVIAKFKTMQMLDVHVPINDGRELVLSRYTQPEAEHRMLLDQLALKLPKQPPPKITARQVRHLTEPMSL